MSIAGINNQFYSFISIRIMKKFFALAVVAMLSAASFAQTEVGGFFFAPKAGLSVACLTSAPDKYTNKPGFAAGVEVGYQMTENFAITVDALYSGQGMECEEKTYFDLQNPTTYEHKVSLDYLNIPILANYYIVKGLAVKAGIQPGILVSAKSKVKDSLGTTETDIKDNSNSIDFSIPVGLSYEWNNIILDARYNIGITNVNKSGKGYDNKDNKNSVFQLTLGYKLPF